MKHANTPRSQDGMSIVEVLIGSLLIVIIVFVTTAVIGYVKDICVNGTNHLEANKLAMFVLEELLPLQYDTASTEDLHLIQGYHDNNEFQDFCPTSNLPGFQIFYLIGDGVGWTGGDYKEITVAVNWEYKTAEFVSFTVLKRRRVL